MRRFLLHIILSFLSPKLAESRFQLEIQLKTSTRREVTLIVASALAVEPVFRASTLIDDSTPSRFLIDADPHRLYTVKIEARSVKEAGIGSTWLTVRLPANRFSLAPPTVMPPLTGLLIRMQSWYGKRCDIRCERRMNRFRTMRCYNTGVLGCPRGLRGANCSEPLKAETCGCGSGGECGYAEGRTVCVCRAGFEGEKCETRSEEVLEVPVSTFSVFKDPIPSEMSVDEFYEKKRVPNQIVIQPENEIQD